MNWTTNRRGYPVLELNEFEAAELTVWVEDALDDLGSGVDQEPLAIFDLLKAQR